MFDARTSGDLATKRELNIVMEDKDVEFLGIVSLSRRMPRQWKQDNDNKEKSESSIQRVSN